MTTPSTLLILLLALTLPLFLPPPPLPHLQTLTLDTPRTPHIVRFRHYKPASDHLLYLRDNLPSSSSSGWDWIERRNPAAVYPTDFGVLEIEDSVRERVVEEVGRLGLVRDVSVDMRYTRRGLEWEGGAFGDGMKRRPGKIFTRMSFDEAGNGNGTGELRRRLLMQVGKSVFWFD